MKDKQTDSLTLSKRLPLLGGTLLLCSLLSGCSGLIQPSSLKQDFSLTILHINDHHSHLDDETAQLLLSTGDKREPISLKRGGFPRVTRAMRELAAHSPNVIKMHSGDASTGDLYFTLSEGKADSELMNTVCFDSFVLGNHEFDNTDAGIKKLMGYLHSGTCQTPILSANVRFGASSPLHDAQPPEAILPSVILERGGEKIGIIGLTVAGKTKHSSQPNPDTIFLDEVESAQSEIDKLQQQGVNKIILSTHIGYQRDQKLAAQLSGVDAIIGGDSHSLLGPESLTKFGLTPEGPYPTRTVDHEGNPVCITQAWQYGYVVGEVHLSFDSKGHVKECNGTPWLLIGDQFKHKDGKALTAQEETALREDVQRSGLLRITKPDAEAVATLAPYKKEKEALGDKVIAKAEENLCLRRVPGSKRDTSRSTFGDVCNQNPRVNAHGGDMQQLVAEAFLQQGRKFFDADLSLQNGGGVRIDLAPGPITVKDIYTVLPFKNTLVQLNATGQEIKDTLEDAVEGVVGPGQNTGCYPYAGGLRWHIDLNQPKGSRLSQLEIREKNGRYTPFKLDQTYTVATISFLADGNDSFTTLKTITGPRRVDVGLDYAEAFLAYVNNLPGNTKRITPLEEEHYSTQVFRDTP